MSDLAQREQSVLAAIQHAGRASELMGQARWWVDSRSQQQKAAAEAQTRAVEAAERAEQAAAASQEVQAAEHASAVQAASRAETEATAAGSSSSSSGKGGGGGAAAGAQQPLGAGAPGAASQASDAGASSTWRWQAVGRWAERVSGELRSAVGQVERLERGHQHEAAVARLHAVLETFTDVTRFPK